MRVPMSKSLHFWVDVENQRQEKHVPGHPRIDRISQILRKFEEAGDAMRYLNKKGEIAWKATPGMLSRLGDAEQEAKDDMDDCP
jgi:hypothetical protein